MPGTFAEWAVWPDREEIVLAELTPRLVLTGWTATGGGAPNCYQVACPTHVGHASVPGGVYRRVVGLQQNAAPLTERTSLALCNSNAGSWFWDEAAGTLYAHTTTAADPDTFTVVAASVRFYLATTGLVLDRVDGDASTGIYHQPWLRGEAPVVVQEVEDILFGVKVTPNGGLAATNGHGFWHTVVARDGGAYEWKHARVSVLLGGRYRGQSLDRSAYAPVATMLVDDVACHEETCSWVLKPIARLTEQELPVTPHFGAALGQGVQGTKKWLGYGRAWMAPDLTDTGGLGVWTVADAAYQTLTRVHRVYAVATSGGAVAHLAEGLHYTVDLTACTLTVIDPAYSWQTHRLEADVTGKPGGARGYLSTFREIVEDILTVHLGVAAADIDSASFAAAQAAAPQELAMWIKAPRQVASLLATREANQPSLGASVSGTVLQSRAGLWQLRIWTPQIDPTGLPTLRREDLAVFDPQPKLEAIYSAVRVHYGYHHARGEWQSDEDSDARTQHLTGSRDRLDLWTFLRSAGSAEVLAARALYVLTHAPLQVAFAERGTRLALSNAGDRMLVSYAPAPVAAGAFVDRACQITRLEQRFAPQFSISGVLEDLDGFDGLARSIGRWMSSSAPNWATATAAERLLSGFWCTTNGRADAGDAASEGVSRWW